MPTKVICVSIDEEDLEFIKEKKYSATALLRRKIEEERCLNDR